MVVFLFVAVIVASIMVHELGHFLAARRFGMKAERFFFGFGPTIWSVRRGETEYGVKAIPAGGFVKISGMNRYEAMNPADRPRAFFSKPAWQRAVVLVAGSFTHFVLGGLLLFIAMAFFALPRLDIGPLENVVMEVVPDSPAAAAGLRPGDRIVGIEGESTASFEAVRTVVTERPGERVELEIERSDQVRRVPVELGSERGVGFLGVVPEQPEPSERLRRRTLAEALTGVVVGEYSLPVQTGATISGLAQVLQPDNLAAWLQQADGETPRTPEGPVSLVGAGQVAVSLANLGEFSFVILLLAQLQIVIGVLNMLPLPPFDGGHLAVLGVERGVNAIREHRGLPGDWQVDPASLIPITLAVLLFFTLFALTAVYVDIVNPVSGLVQ